MVFNEPNGTGIFRSAWLAACGALVCLVILAGCGSILPKDWPIKELTLPYGVKAAAMPEMMKSINEMTNSSGFGEKTWNVAFNYDKGWDKLEQHIDAKLSALGYSKKDFVGEAGKVLDGSSPFSDMGPDMSKFSRMWTSSNSHFLVTLQNASMFKGMEGGPEKEKASFVLSVTQIDASLAPGLPQNV